MKTDSLSEAWRENQPLGQRAVVAAGLMGWLRKGILAGGYGCGQKGRGRRATNPQTDRSAVPGRQGVEKKT